jgi:hypothetical protein
MFYKTFKSWRSVVGRRLYKGRSNGRKLLSYPRPTLGCRAVIEVEEEGEEQLFN